MTVVKGTKQRRVKVVEDRPVYHRLVNLGVICLVLIGIAGSFYIGHIEGMAGQEKALDDVSRLKNLLDQSQKEVKELRQSVTNVELGAEVDRQANEEVRQQVIDLKEQIASLQEENGFYKGLMAPSESRKGLTIGAVEILNTDRSRAFRYKVVMQQLATNHILLNGNLKFTIIGRVNELEKQYSLAEVSEQYKGESIKLRFKYFQTIAGELTLPEGFEPEGIELVAQSTGKNATTVKKRFGWLVQEI